jgi:hypothetical protein
MAEMTAEQVFEAGIRIALSVKDCAPDFLTRSRIMRAAEIALNCDPCSSIPSESPEAPEV